MAEALCVDATCSAVSSTSTGELHERLYTLQASIRIT
jgi:hypothetical protein